MDMAAQVMLLMSARLLLASEAARLDALQRCWHSMVQDCLFVALQAYWNLTLQGCFALQICLC